MTNAHTTVPASSKRERPRRYEVRVHGRVSSAVPGALGPVQARYEPPASVLTGALDQPQLYALLERLLTDVPLPVLDVRIVGAEPRRRRLVSADPRHTIDPRAHSAAALLDKRHLHARDALGALWRTHATNDL
jgi:hypothetical protein